uniref:Uncharacterized protein n=1 Tax=Oryza rufipogon TaxID=4529 RepID=A0A0E0QMV7_ORYRU
MTQHSGGVFVWLRWLRATATAAASAASCEVITAGMRGLCVLLRLKPRRPILVVWLRLIPRLSYIRPGEVEGALGQLVVRAATKQALNYSSKAKVAT